MNPNSQPGWWNFKYFFVCFHPEKWGRWTHFDDHMFQRGWFNQQLETVFRCSKYYTSIQFTQEAPSVHGLFGLFFSWPFQGFLVTSIWVIERSLGRRWPRMLGFFVKVVLLMEEILHHLGCVKPCKWRDKLPINWCRISSINSISKL